MHKPLRGIWLEKISKQLALVPGDYMVPCHKLMQSELARTGIWSYLPTRTLVGCDFPSIANFSCRWVRFAITRWCSLNVYSARQVLHLWKRGNFGATKLFSFGCWVELAGEQLLQGHLPKKPVGLCTWLYYYGSCSPLPDWFIRVCTPNYEYTLTWLSIMQL